LLNRFATLAVLPEDDRRCWSPARAIAFPIPEARRGVAGSLLPSQTVQGKLRLAGREVFMAEELDFSNPEHAAGSTMAAFALAQMCFSICKMCPHSSPQLANSRSAEKTPAGFRACAFC
jgi:hypothetical protein